MLNALWKCDGTFYDHRAPHTTCSSDRWEGSRHDFCGGYCQSSGGSTNWRSEATQSIHQRRLLLKNNISKATTILIVNFQIVKQDLKTVFNFNQNYISL